MVILGGLFMVVIAVVVDARGMSAKAAMDAVWSPWGNGPKMQAYGGNDGSAGAASPMVHVARTPPIAPIIGVSHYFDPDTGRVVFVSNGRPVAGIAHPGTSASAPASAATYKVLAEYPHDTGAFTQGLFVHQGVMFESTGWYGESNVRKVDVATGRVLHQTALPPHIFGEGITMHNGMIHGMSWKERWGFIMDPSNLKILKETRMPDVIKEGWGIVSTGEHIMVSDSTDKLHTFDSDWKYMHSVVVRDPSQDNVAVPYVNEMELINGKIWANVIGIDHIAIIEPASGMVERWIDCDGLWPGAAQGPESPRGGNDVLNGIAYDEDAKKLYVTGKRWSSLFLIETDALEEGKHT